MADYELVIAAKRFAAMALAIALALVTGIGLRRGNWTSAASPKVRRLRWVGVCLFAAGFAVHQAFWWQWQMMRVAARPAIASAMEAVQAWPMVISYMLMISGMTIAVAQFTESRFGGRWLAFSIATVCVLLAIGALVAAGARP